MRYCPTRKGHTYKVYSCSKSCGLDTVHMDEIDTAAIKYLRELLSSENQARITEALCQYQTGEQDGAKDFNRTLNQRIAEKQNNIIPS